MLDQLKNQWQQASAARKSLLLGGVLIIVLLFVASIFWVMREDYQVLFSDLSGQDAAAMTAELERLKVPYQLADDGSTILVEREAVYKTRLKLMGKGLNLNGSVGFEIFNNSEFGMTEFAQKVNYQRALQGELARTIMAFDEVKSARVHLVLPESGLFKRQNAKPKASVSIQLKDGSGLAQEQVSGIQRLVAASVPEISPAEVTVVDQHGIAVTKPIMAQQAEAVLHERLDIKKQLEDYMTRKIVSVVDRAVGPGKAIVSVDVALNYDQVKITKEDVVPLPDTSGQEVGAIVRRKENIQGEESWDNSAIQEKSAQRWMPSSSQIETEYLNSKRVEQVLSAQGNIVRLNVGVLVPETEDKVKLAKLKEMIAMVAGIDIARGDGLVVYGVDTLQAPGNEALQVVEPDAEGNNAVAELPAAARKTSAQAAAGFNPLWLLGAAVLALLLILVLRNKTSSKPKLSAAEREQLLAELSDWASNAKRI